MHIEYMNKKKNQTSFILNTTTDCDSKNILVRNQHFINKMSNLIILMLCKYSYLLDL